MTQTMGDPVTQGQFYQAIQELDDKGQARHARVRESIEDGFRRLEQKLEEHAAEDRLVADRVLKIETQREEEAKLALRRGTWAGILAGIASNGVLAVVKAWWK